MIFTKYRIAETLISSFGYSLNAFNLFETDNNESSSCFIVLGDYSVQLNNKLRIKDLAVKFSTKQENIEIMYFESNSQDLVSKLLIDYPNENATLTCFCDFDYIKEYVSHVLFFDFFKIRLLYTPGINLHAAAIDWKGKGILFSAPSETGKSTQAQLWCENEAAEIINGDRPAITLIDGNAVVHGTPWSGSDPIIRNVSVPVTCIVVIEQAKVNEISILSKVEALSLLLPRFFIPNYNEYLTNKALDVIEKIIDCVPIYKLKCLPDKGAVEVLKNELSLLEE